MQFTLSASLCTLIVLLSPINALNCWVGSSTNYTKSTTGPAPDDANPPTCTRYVIECRTEYRDLPAHDCAKFPASKTFVHYGYYNFLERYAPWNKIENFKCDNEDYCNTPIPFDPSATTSTSQVAATTEAAPSPAPTDATLVFTTSITASTSLPLTSTTSPKSTATGKPDDVVSGATSQSFGVLMVAVAALFL